MVKFYTFLETLILAVFIFQLIQQNKLINSLKFYEISLLQITKSRSLELTSKYLTSNVHSTPLVLIIIVCTKSSMLDIDMAESGWFVNVIFLRH